MTSAEPTVTSAEPTYRVEADNWAFAGGWAKTLTCLRCCASVTITTEQQAEAQATVAHDRWHDEIRRVLTDVAQDVAEGIRPYRRPGPRTFLLHRDEDETGVSGTGIVAEGIVFTDGPVALRWIVGEHRSTVVWPSVEAVEAIHGHGGKTRIVWT